MLRQHFIDWKHATNSLTSFVYTGSIFLWTGNQLESTVIFLNSISIILLFLKTLHFVVYTCFGLVFPNFIHTHTHTHTHPWVWLFCDPLDCSPPGSSVHGISQARILEWVAISFSRGSSWPRDWTHVSWIGRQILYHWATQEALSVNPKF